MLNEGDPVPEISAKNQNGETVEPSFEGVSVVYFYPRDGTPGCTTEANQFEIERQSYEDAGVDVYGVSTDDVESHSEFADDEGVEFDLLADPYGEVAEKFGVPVNNGRAERTTFVIVDGEVRNVYRNVSPDGHAGDVLLDMLDEGIVNL